MKERVEIVGGALLEVVQNPRHDDEVLGPSIFRMLLEGASLSDLTLTGLYVGRSVLKNCSFWGSDLSLATFNWNGLERCSFEGSILSRADLRACKFVRCRFDEAVLKAADLRGSSFEGCTFGRADFSDALLFRRSLVLHFLRLGADQSGLPLSAEQRRSATWCAEAPKPGGG